MAQPGGADSSTDTAANTEPGVARAGTDWATVYRTVTPWLNRAGSLVAAGLLLFAATEWWDRARELSEPCRTTGKSQAVCTEVPEFLQALQFVLAIAGIAVAVLLAVLTVYQAVSGRRVPRLRLVAAMLVGVGVAWVAVFAIGLLVLSF